jgi:hypothetical protein
MPRTATLKVVSHPRSYSFQPEPTDVLVARAWNSGGCTTTIFRQWDAKDVARCHLCDEDECQARRDGKPRCLLVIPDHVPDDKIALFDLAAWRERTGNAAR